MSQNCSREEERVGLTSLPEDAKAFLERQGAAVHQEEQVRALSQRDEQKGKDTQWQQQTMNPRRSL